MDSEKNEPTASESSRLFSESLPTVLLPFMAPKPGNAWAQRRELERQQQQQQQASTSSSDNKPNLPVVTYSDVTTLAVEGSGMPSNSLST
jgi:hypothetical protein